MPLAVRRWSGSFVIWLVVGCVADVRVSIGAVQETISLGKCTGEATSCVRDPSLEVEVIYLANSHISTCALADGEPWRVAWKHALGDQRCGEFGTCAARDVAIAPDGTAWTVGLAGRTSEGGEKTLAGVLLSHFGPAGEPLGDQVIDTRTFAEFKADEHALTLAADAQGYVFVAVAWTERSAETDQVETSAWLAKFDSTAQLIGARVALRGVTANMALDLTVASSVFLVASETGATPGGGPPVTRMAKLELDLDLSWVQTEGLPQGSARATLANGEIACLIAPSSTSPDNVTQLEVYSADGNPSTTLVLQPKMEPFGMDVSGNVLVNEDPEAAEPIVRKLTPDGRTLFRVALDRFDAAPLNEGLLHALGADSAGNSYLVRPVFRLDDAKGPAFARLLTLDAGGHSCASALLLEGDSVPHLDDPRISVLSVSDRGDLYLLLGATLVRLVR